MPSKSLMRVWAFVDSFLLGAGVVTLVLSLIWKGQDMLRNLVINDTYLTVGLALGIVLLVTWALSIAAIIQPAHETRGLVALNWMLIIDAIGLIVIGTSVWFFTLQERANFHKVFSVQSAATQIKLQDMLKCCGYFNATDLLQIGGSVCTDLDTAVAVNSTCVGPITSYADMTLNNMFTTVYGYMAIIICLFLATTCVINKRIESERFRRIDEKRGGRGFV